ncbi:hypothetical protein JOB18_001836 [Solea senegalensis]|uniref:Uncharacterized protein n=1 Tax=Solea senegalensis TaxID=28829 RepID=A0AAV6RP35_SOLSE|nr:hypothetical protein JOB18_001836 [Solea senegalensis]
MEAASHLLAAIDWRGERRGAELSVYVLSSLLRGPIESKRNEKPLRLQFLPQLKMATANGPEDLANPPKKTSTTGLLKLRQGGQASAQVLHPRLSAPTLSGPTLTGKAIEGPKTTRSGLLQRISDTALTKTTMLYERVPTTDDHREDYENAAPENAPSDLIDDDLHGNLWDEDKDNTV